MPDALAVLHREAIRSPIGVFDSGVGGLTVLKSLRSALPGRDFLYLGDTARVPYGRKPREMVREFAYGIAGFLMELGVEGLVIACNTASAAVLPEMAQVAPIPVWGVIEPGVEAARRHARSGRVGVIGTKGAIASGAYQSRLQALGLQVWAKACPMLVHVVEEGLADSLEAEMLVRHYLEDRPELDALILGCTHYPVLRPLIQRVVGEDVHLVSSADVTAEMVGQTLGGNGDGSRAGRIVHFVTGDVLAYQHTAQVIGGVDGAIVALDVTTLAEKEQERFRAGCEQAGSRARKSARG
jgi:glutamate racemase